MNETFTLQQMADILDAGAAGRPRHPEAPPTIDQLAAMSAEGQAIYQEVCRLMLATAA